MYELMWSDGIKASPPVPTDILTPMHCSMHLSPHAVDALEPLLQRTLGETLVRTGQRIVEPADF